MMKFLVYFIISISLISSTEIDFFSIKIEKGKNREKVYSSNGQLLDKAISIINFPEELSTASKEGYNISSLCETENVNITKISKIDIEFKDGVSTQNIRCYNRKNILFYESEILENNSFKVSKYDINGILDQRKMYHDNLVEFYSYYDNGQILKEGNFKNHKKEGIWKEYYKDGNLKSITEFKKDRIINIIKY